MCTFKKKKSLHVNKGSALSLMLFRHARALYCSCQSKLQVWCYAGLNALSLNAGGLLLQPWSGISTARLSFPGEQLQTERWTPDGRRCWCPSSGSFHTTSAPSLFFCLIRNLSSVFPSSSHLTGCSTDGSQGDNYGRFIRMGRASVDRQCVSVLILLISLGNWPISWCDTTFHQSCETYICVSNEWLCLCVTVFRFMQLW